MAPNLSFKRGNSMSEIVPDCLALNLRRRPEFLEFRTIDSTRFCLFAKILSYPPHPSRFSRIGRRRVTCGFRSTWPSAPERFFASPLFRMRKTTIAVFFKQPFENILNEALFGFLIILFKANLKEV